MLLIVLCTILYQSIHTYYMGIIRLGTFFKTTYPHLLKPQKVENYRKRVFAVDAASTIYSFLAKTISKCEMSQLSRNKKSTCRLIHQEI